MSGLCLIAGLLVASLGDAITLRWTHSIEKIVWEEDWRATPDGQVLAQARIRGSGAGMEIPEGATWRDGAWHYQPVLPPQAEVFLRHSPHVTPYEICVKDRCAPIGEWLPGLPADSLIQLRPC